MDIRSEPAIRLLSDFLDARGSEGRERRGTEHFIHGEHLLNCDPTFLSLAHSLFSLEFVCFMRSPYRDLALYDAVVQVSFPNIPSVTG
jgi:hypothetical protein